MRRTKHTAPTVIMIALATGLVGYVLGSTREERSSNAQATAQESAVAEAQKKSITPTGQLYDPNVYFPGTEQLGKDEMRIVACGTGMPTARASQAASCWLVELGNGDKFIFDAGTGSAERVASMHIPYDYLNKIFIGGGFIRGILRKLTMTCEVNHLFQ